MRLPVVVGDHRIVFESPVIMRRPRRWIAGEVMADNSEDAERRARAEGRFETLPRIGYWSPLRIVVAILVAVAFVVAALVLWLR
jgi:hypothetical protein